MRTKHGFLTPYIDEKDGLVSTQFATLHMDGQEMNFPNPFAVETLVELAVSAGLTHLWIVPGYTYADTTEERARLVPVNLEAQEKQQNYDIKMFKHKPTGLVGSLVGRRITPRTDNVSVIWLARCAWHYESIEQFSQFIADMERELGVPMKGSPTSVGLRYLEKIDTRYYKRYFAQPDVDKAEMKVVFRNAARPLVWHRKPTKDELTPRPERYLMAVDKRAAYPRVSLEKFGIGQPVEYHGEFNHKLPGVWDVEVSGLEKIDSRLPEPLWKGWEQGGLVTPIVKMLRDFGCSIRVNEALVWTDTAPVFERWAKGLWEVRQRIPGLKPVMNNTLGFTINGNDIEDEKFRPDWHAQVVGALRALMMYNAAKVAGESGFYPVGCYIDALYYLTPYRNNVAGLPLQPDSMGGYALKWCHDMKADVSGVFGCGLWDDEELEAEIRAQLPAHPTVQDVLLSSVAWNHQLGVFNRLAGERY